MDAILTNTRPTLLGLPTVGKPGKPGFFPAVRLAPGATKVEEAYVDALDACTGGAGKVWVQWQALGIVRVQRKAPADAKEGPLAPATLADRKPEAAEAMVAVEDDPDTLRQWYASDRREAVRKAIQAKLSGLGESLEPKARGKGGK